MIEVQAKLLRDVVYVAGDSVECLVTFVNKQPDGNHSGPDENSVSRRLPENLAWASAQIHCHCSVDESKVRFPKSPSQEQMATGSTDTSFIPCRGEKGYVVFSSKPKILFCDLRLLPGESKSCACRACALQRRRLCLSRGGDTCDEQTVRDVVSLP